MQEPAVEQDALIGDEAIGRIRRIGAEALLSDAQVRHGLLIGRDTHGFAEAQNAIVAAIDHLEIAVEHSEAARCGEGCGAGGAGALRSIRAGGVGV